ncbi:uncharacterized protein LOC144102165 [Amblyomma americanum]
MSYFLITMLYSSPDDSPIKVTPNVLLCATNGLGAQKLGEALDTYCTHVIYTGPMAIERSQTSGKPYVNVKDRDGYSVFSGLTKNHERFLSFRWKTAIWNEGDVLHALVVYLRYYKLRGVELVMGSHLDSTKFIRFCQAFVQQIKNNASLIIRVERTVDLTRGLFERLTRLPQFLVLETQAVQIPGLQTRRFPNPYQPFAGSHTRDVYMMMKVDNEGRWQVQQLARHVI